MTTAIQSDALIPIQDAQGVLRGSLKIFSRTGAGRGVAMLPQAEAVLNGEEVTQIFENGEYEYELEPSSLRLDCEGTLGVVRQSVNPSMMHTGEICPGGYLGRLSLIAVGDSGDIVGTCAVEVTSNKIDYRSQYRQMLEDIAENGVALALSVLTPTHLRLSPQPGASVASLAQQYAFLRGLLSSSFRAAIEMILSRPHRRLFKSRWLQDPRQGVRPSASTLRGLAKATRRVPIPSSHPLAVRVRSLPSEIPVVRYEESSDTAENRFIKFALETFLAFLGGMRQRLQLLADESARRVAREASLLQRELQRYLSADFFRGVSSLEYLPLSSSVLQQKVGYREVLQAWLRFDVAARVAWEGGDDVFGAGQKNVATLYEYWVFFQLLGMFSRLCGQESPSASDLVEPTPDGCALRVKAGRQVTVRGLVTTVSGDVAVRLDYNRTFVGRKTLAEVGSWTQSMRPDYTFSIWPNDMNEAGAAARNLLVHVHFDAKYRVQRITELFGLDEATANESDLCREVEHLKRDEACGIYRRADLLKMHAYKDAVRRSYGAYVVYPGDANKVWEEYSEILPGLGAFAVVPGGAHECLESFLKDVVTHSAQRFASADQR